MLYGEPARRPALPLRLLDHLRDAFDGRPMGESHLEALNRWLTRQREPFYGGLWGAYAAPAGGWSSPKRAPRPRIAPHAPLAASPPFLTLTSVFSSSNSSASTAIS